MIDIERSNDTDKVQDKVINDGVININSQKSVGIDFGKYMNGLLKVDVELGTINVNGSNNYGFRMSNIFDGTTDYYKDEDGSSKRIISFSEIPLAVIAINCFSPPDSSKIFLSNKSLLPKTSE